MPESQYIEQRDLQPLNCDLQNIKYMTESFR